MMTDIKICFRCKLGFPADNKYFTIRKNGRPNSYCKKCQCLNAKEYRLKSDKKSICQCCRIEFTVPRDKNNKGIFCSNKCFWILTRKTTDDSEFLAKRGIVNYFSR